MDVKIGVFQGSTLGPLLFILYPKDLTKSLVMLKSIHFADDTTLSLDINPCDDHTSLINSELPQVQTRTNAKKIVPECKKNNYMIISNKNQIININISLNGQPIAKSPTIVS